MVLVAVSLVWFGLVFGFYFVIKTAFCGCSGNVNCFLTIVVIRK